MSKKFNIKPPIWPKELTFEEFKRLNPHINENQLIPLYNQYLNKYLTELTQKKIHFKQSKNHQLQVEIKKFSNLNMFDTYDDISIKAGGGGFQYEGYGIGFYAVGTYLYSNLVHTPVPADGGFPRFTVGRPGPAQQPDYDGASSDGQEPL